MKVLWLSHLIPFPPKGGVLQRSFNLIKELSKYHDVDLLSFNQRALIGPLFESVESGVKEARFVLDSICKRFEIFRIPSESYPGGRFVLALKSLVDEPYTINWLKSRAFGREMADWLRQENYEIVHFDTISLVPFFNLIPPNIKTTLDHHNIESHMLLRRARKEKNLIKRWYFHQEGIRLKKYERNFCPRFSVNITCSDIDSARLQKISPEAVVRTIPNGVDLNFFRPRSFSSEPNRLVFVGRMSAYSNIDAVLFIAKRLWPRLKVKYPDLVFDIVGSNPPNSITTLAENLTDFNVRGYVDDVRPFIEAATVYVCPIRDGGGTKLKVLDAMAMAKAIVAHPVACEGIFVEHDHNVLLAENEDMFIESICYLLENPEKRNAMGEAARELMKNYYGYQAIGLQLAGVFQQIVGKSRM